MRSDWHEFQMLRMQCKAYKNGWKAWRERLNRETGKYGTGCKKVVYKPNSYARAKNSVIYCKKFFEKKCPKDCPLYDVHGSYWHFLNQYNKKRQEVADFWRNKFQNVK